MYGYDRVSESYIQESIDKALYDKLYDPCYNLSCILADIDGRISTGMLTQVLTGLDIVAPGVVVLGETGEEVEDPVLPEHPYGFETSQAAYPTYLKLRESSDELVIYLSENSGLNPSSYLLSLSSDQAPTLRSAINTLYIEALAVYRALLALRAEELLTITKADLLRVVNNARWISTRLESQVLVPYDLLEVIRDLQITIFYISNISGIFSDEKTVMLQKLSELSDSVTDKTDNYVAREYVVQSGDNIHSIAQKTLGDANKAIDLIVFNNLEYPFVDTESNDPNVKKMGDVILIPTFEQASETNRYLYLGSDLRIVDRTLAGGDLEADIYGDLQIVDGIDCLTQDLNTRFSVELGSLLFHPEFGSGLLSLVGQKGDSSIEQKARVEALRIFNSDSRISRVRNLSVIVLDRTIRVEALLEIASSADPVEFRTTVERGNSNGSTS